MNRMRILLNLYAVILLFISGTLTLHAQQVAKYSGPDQALPSRWKWAKEEAAKRGWNSSYWIGYSIVKLMGENSFTGTFYSDPRRNRPSLCEELELGMCVHDEVLNRSFHDGSMTEGTVTFNDETGREKKVTKELALLFEISSDTKEPVSSVVISNFSLHVNLHNEPVVWIGPAEDTESIAFLRSLYDGGQSEHVQKRIIETIGLHGPSDNVIAFLSSVAQHADRSTLREEAAFWLGQTNGKNVVPVLQSVAEHDESKNVREKAIFALSQMENDNGVESLISIARNSQDRENRSKAMFWLGQKASERAVSTIKDIADNDEDTEVQKNALFALMQLPDGKGVDELITIAKTHKNPRIRKQAIFWLGQSDDKRALDVLIDIVKK